MVGLLQARTAGIEALTGIVGCWRGKGRSTMAGRVMQRGENWMLDLGFSGKVRPALVVSVPFLDNEKTLVTYVPRTTRVRGPRFEVPHTPPLIAQGVFDVQSIGSAPAVSFLRKLASLDVGTLARIEDALRFSMSL